MTDALFALGDQPVVEQPKVQPMTPSQRAEIRDLFGRLQVTDARAQFVIVKELTGTDILSVADMSAASAHTLIQRLTLRIGSAGAARTGNAWDDREEDTWIDRL